MIIKNAWYNIVAIIYVKNIYVNKMRLLKKEKLWQLAKKRLIN